MSNPDRLSRRQFISKSAVAGTAVPLFVSSKVRAQPGKPGANDRIRLGLIGAGGMGRYNLKNCARYDDVVVTAICDVWKERRDATIAEHGGKPKPYNDYRDLLKQKDVDAVIIASPPHWHALMAIDACEAGKDIYLQKPMTLHLAESLAVKAAVKKHQRISQVGTQIHASQNYHRVVDHVRSGNLSLELGRSIRFEPATEKIVGDPHAAALSVPKYRSPWRFPKEYLDLPTADSPSGRSSFHCA